MTNTVAASTGEVDVQTSTVNNASDGQCRRLIIEPLGERKPPPMQAI